MNRLSPFALALLSLTFARAQDAVSRVEAVGAAPGAPKVAVATKPGAPAAAAKKVEEKPKEEEADVDMGGLFGDDY